MYFIDNKAVSFSDYMEHIRRYWSDEDLSLTLTTESGEPIATVPVIEAQELVEAA